MRLLIIQPRQGIKLKAAMDSKRKSMQAKGGSFALDRRGKWVHVRHRGWVNVKRGPHGMIFAKTNTLAAEREWEILTAFIGFLDRHFHDEIASITIQYG